jgi:hypothetical protein
VKTSDSHHTKGSGILRDILVTRHFPLPNKLVRALRMQILGRNTLALIVIFTALSASCATTTTVRHQEAPHESPAAEMMIPRLDPNHLPHIGNAYYPMVSRSIPEEGICKMGITVEPDGRVSESHLVETSGFLRLDAACVNAFPADVRFIPATNFQHRRVVHEAKYR